MHFKLIDAYAARIAFRGHGTHTTVPVCSGAVKGPRVATGRGVRLNMSMSRLCASSRKASRGISPWLVAAGLAWAVERTRFAPPFCCALLPDGAAWFMEMPCAARGAVASCVLHCASRWSQCKPLRTDGPRDARRPARVLTRLARSSPHTGAKGESCALNQQAIDIGLLCRRVSHAHGARGSGCGAQHAA